MLRNSNTFKTSRLFDRPKLYRHLNLSGDNLMCLRYRALGRNNLKRNSLCKKAPNQRDVAKRSLASIAGARPPLPVPSLRRNQPSMSNARAFEIYQEKRNLLRSFAIPEGRPETLQSPQIYLIAKWQAVKSFDETFSVIIMSWEFRISNSTEDCAQDL